MSRSTRVKTSEAGTETPERRAVRPLLFPRELVAAGCIAALVAAALVVPGGLVFRPTRHEVALPEAQTEEYRMVRPPPELAFDSLKNTSLLSDDELRYHFEGLMESQVAEILDQDRDGIADGTRVEVMEFIERMKIILSDREPFEYRVTPQGIPVVRVKEL